MLLKCINGLDCDVILGKSLLWVGVYIIVIIYIFALGAFGGLRENMEQNMRDSGVEQFLYCRTLYECSVTMLRYGLVGELFEVTIYSIFEEIQLLLKKIISLCNTHECITFPKRITVFKRSALK